MNGEPINFNADDEKYEVLKHAKINILRAMIFIHSFSFPMGSTAAFQCEDEGPWTHGIVEEANCTDHHGWGPTSSVMKPDRLIMCNRRHICSTLITQQYFLEQIKKGDWTSGRQFHGCKIS